MIPEVCEEALLLEPKEVEFKDFVSYTKEIRPIVERHGICVVRPPSSWNPTFVIDLNKNLFSFENDIDDKRFSIYEFGNLADGFKMNFFRQPVDKVKPDKLEDTFWNLYINDVLPSEVRKVSEMKMSGFPSKSCPELSVEDKEYLNSTWNFNNTNSQCLLKYLTNTNYSKTNQTSSLNMCFSHQSWRIEDAFSFALHFIHWGDSKTWYCIRQPNKELIRILCSKQNLSRPQLADHIRGHKIIRARQSAGDFVFIHSGAASFSLSHGFNFSERISYLPQDWFHQGLAYLKLFSDEKVQPLPFSLEELVFKYLRCLRKCRSSVVEKLKELMTFLVEEEMLTRNNLKVEFLNLHEEKKIFELINEDLRSCNSCKKILFLSSLFCHSCKKVSCPQCYLKASICINCSNVTHPPSFSFFWRYSDSELSLKVSEVVDRSENQSGWMKRALVMLGKINNSEDSEKGDGRMSLQELYQLREESINLVIDDLALVNEVNEVIRSSEQIQMKLENLFIDDRQESTAKPTLTEVKSLLEDMKNSRCKTSKLEAVEEVIQGIEDFISDVRELLSQCPLISSSQLSPSSSPQITLQLRAPQPPKVMEMMMTMIDFKKTKALLAKSKKIVAEIGETEILEKYYERCDWIRNVQSGVEKLGSSMTMDGLQKMIALGEQLHGQEGPLSEVTLEVICFLQNYVKYFKDLDRAMKHSLDSSPPKSMSDLNELVEASRNFPKITFSNLSSVKKVLQDAQTWENHVDVLLNGEVPPYLHNVKSHLLKGRGIPVVLNRYDQLERDVKAAELWLDELSSVFLKNPSDDLIEVLAPRMNILEVKSCKKGQKRKRSQMLLGLFTESDDSIKIVENAIKASEATELEEMQIMRKVNGDKILSEDSKYCFCRQPMMPGMFECRLCKELFHESCINSLNSNKENDPSSSSLEPSQSMLASNFLAYGQMRPTSSVQLVERFLCPSCHRSKRPTMNQLISLIGSSLNLSVRVAEARFLQALADRTSAWQFKVTRYLRTEEYTSAFKQLSVVAKKMKNDLGLLTEDEVKEKLAYQKILDQAYAITGRPDPKPEPLQVDLPKEVFNKLEMMEVEGDLLEVRTKETLRLEEVCIAYKLHMERSKDEAKIMQSHTDDVIMLDNRSTPNKVIVTKKKRGKAEDPENSKKTSKKSKITSSKEEGPAKIRFYPQFKAKKNNVKSANKVPKPLGSRGNNFDNNSADKSDPTELSSLQKHKSFDDDDDGDDDGDDGQNDNGVEGDNGKGRINGTNKDDSDDCPAKVCLRPTGNEVNWVQCDRCLRWFHFQCIGLTIKDISEEEEFECSSCIFA